MAEFQINIAPKQLIFLQVVLVVSLLTLIAGVLLPIVTIEKFYLVENRFSILSGTIQLFIEQRYFLFVLIALFSILLPVLKLGVLYQILNSVNAPSLETKRYLHWMHLYGKWSMLDVFVVAILVVSVKLGAIASVEVHLGLYAFAISVLSTMFLTARIVSITNDD